MSRPTRIALALFASIGLQIAAVQAGSITITAMVPAPGERNIVKTIEVTAEGIPPTDQAHAQMLYDRLDAVIRTICGGLANRPASAWFAKRVEACRRQTLAGTVAAIGSPLLRKAAAEK